MESNQDYLIERHESKRIVCFKLSEMDFAVYIQNVREVISMREVRKVPRVPSFIEGVINLRGNVIPLVNLRKLLGLQLQDYSQARVIILSVNSSLSVGFMVDEASSVRLIKKKDLLAAPPVKIRGIDQNCIEGVISGDENSILLINLLKMVSRDDVQLLGKTLKQL